jgi:hypothetical protein
MIPSGRTQTGQSKTEAPLRTGTICTHKTSERLTTANQSFNGTRQPCAALGSVTAWCASAKSRRLARGSLAIVVAALVRVAGARSAVWWRRRKRKPRKRKSRRNPQREHTDARTRTHAHTRTLSHIHTLHTLNAFALLVHTETEHNFPLVVRRYRRSSRFRRSWETAKRARGRRQGAERMRRRGQGAQRLRELPAHRSWRRFHRT